jgi:hypothetical protein
MSLSRSALTARFGRLEAGAVALAQRFGDRAVEVHRARFRLLAGRARGLGHVERHVESDVTASSVSGPAPATVVTGHEAREIGDRDRAGRHEDRQPHAPGVEPLVVTGQAAATDAELEPSLAEMVDRRHVFGQPQGMAQGQNLDGDADLHLPRGHGER